MCLVHRCLGQQVQRQQAIRSLPESRRVHPHVRDQRSLRDQDLRDEPGQAIHPKEQQRVGDPLRDTAHEMRSSRHASDAPLQHQSFQLAHDRLRRLERHQPTGPNRACRQRRVGHRQEPRSSLLAIAVADPVVRTTKVQAAAQVPRVPATTPRSSRRETTLLRRTSRDRPRRPDRPTAAR